MGGSGVTDFALRDWKTRDGVKNEIATSYLKLIRMNSNLDRCQVLRKEMVQKFWSKTFQFGCATGNTQVILFAEAPRLYP